MTALFDAPVVCPVLIGRAAHVDALRRALDQAAGGAGGALLLAGEAGIGKSRLVAEARTLAGGRGFLVLQGRTFETDRALPYGPLLDLLRGRIASLSAERLVEEAGAETAELLWLLPELAARLPGVAAAPALDPEQDRRRLFHALSQFLLRLAARGPLLLVIEDAHWADSLSLEVLAYLARCLAPAPALLLVTYRSDEVGPELRRLLASLDRDRLASELRISRLSLGETEAMVRATVAGPHSVRADLLHALYGLSEGNPFFIEEILCSLGGEAGADALEGASVAELRIPRSVQDAVQRRLAQLSDSAREALSFAAVAGQRWDFALLQELTGRDEPALLTVVKELIAAQLVVEESADRFAFRHALTREAVYSDLLARERWPLHGRIAATLERQRAADLEAHLPDLSYHVFEAGDWPRALEYGRRAGERAQALYASRAAIEHFGRAIEAAGRLGLPAPALYRARGNAHETLGEFDQAHADHEQALDAARAAGDPREEWEALQALGFLWAGRDYDRCGEYFQSALDLARRLGDPALLARSLNRVGNWHVNMEEPHEAQRRHREALAILRERADEPGIAETLDLLGMALTLGCDTEAGSRCYIEAAARFRALGDRRGEAAALSSHALVGLHYQADTFRFPLHQSQEEAFREAEEALTIARAIGWRAGETYALLVGAHYTAAWGRFGEALDRLRSAARIAEETGHRQWLTFARCTIGRTLHDIGALPEARQHLEEAFALARATRSGHWLRMSAGWLARALIVDGDLDRAQAILSEALGDGRPDTLAARNAWLARLELTLARRQPEHALTIVDEMTAAMPPGASGASPALALRRAEALAALGRAGEAEPELLALIAFLEREEARAYLWRAQAALATLYHAQGRSDETRRAVAAARATIEAVAAAVPDEYRTGFLDEAYARLPGGRKAAAVRRTPGGLTPREAEVASLIGRGLSNRAIADRLVLGERTVETHVSNLLAKLDFSSRAQIAAWATAQGLTADR